MGASEMVGGAALIGAIGEIFGGEEIKIGVEIILI